MAAARPTVSVYCTEPAKPTVVGTVPLPAVLTAPIRADVVHDIHRLMAKNKRQAYAVKFEAGMQHSAESWGTGRAVARIPRISGGGTSRSGQAAFGNMCRSGRMFAPTKTWRKWHSKINVNQRRYALTSALAATAINGLVQARGHRISKVVELPLVLSNSVNDIAKTRNALEALTRVGADEDIEKARVSKHLRVGAGKMRNRRYTMRRGPLIVYADVNGDKPALVKAVRNLPGVQSCNVERLNLLDLAPGGHLGRFVIWTQAAFDRLDAIYGTATTKSTVKADYIMPRSMLTVADIARVINSNEVQSVVRATKKGTARATRKKNPLKNLGEMVRLNPYATVLRRAEIKRQNNKTAKANKRTKAQREAGKAAYAKLVAE